MNTTSTARHASIPPSAAVALALALGLLAAGPAAAQNALGSGRALDANLNPASRGLNTAAPAADFRARNLIVTDNVIGGRGFRGSVGYTSDGAFRGATGTDDLYAFRRDSAWSDVNLVDYGYTYQRFRYGQDFGLVEYTRVGENASARSLARRAQAEQVYRSRELIDARLRIDPRRVGRDQSRYRRAARPPAFARGPAIPSGRRGRDDGGRAAAHRSSLAPAVAGGVRLALAPQGQRIERLGSGDADRFNEHLATGERYLREGRYFFAERRFRRALRFTPGHPMATAGLANAQVAAGLYLTASLTLRSLFSYQPEMIDAHYEPGLVPNEVRLKHAVAKLEQRLESIGDRTASAFMLAYVGCLLGDRQYIERGLAVMEKDSPDDPLLPLLKEVWLAED